VLLGAGVAAIAVVGVAGGLFVGKKVYDKHKANQKKSASGSGSFASREVVDDDEPDTNPALAPYHQPHPKTFTQTSPIPDAVALGLYYNENSGAKLNLLASCFDAYGTNLGYIQGGGQLTTLFNNAITHTGEAATGDHENIVVDLRSVPANCSQILFGSYLVETPTTGLPKAHIHILPMLRPDTVEQHGSTPAVHEEEAHEEEHEEEEEDEDDMVKLYQDDLDHTQFGSLRGFVGGKLFRDSNTGSWFLTPYRTPVNADAQFGLWPAFEHYAKPV